MNRAKRTERRKRTILNRTDRSGECWLWTGAVDRYGYGKYSRGKAHRFSFEAFVGPVPAGLVLDHLCKVKRCVRPDHLEPVTNGDNLRRHYADQTHCKHGHEFTEANTYRPPGRNSRQCRACNAKAQQKLKKKALS